jgi:polyisoprenoid-binding protein YceI
LVAPGTDRSPCRGAAALQFDEDMNTTSNPGATIPRLGHYTIDTARSSVTFGGRHLFGLLPVRGTFAVRGGTVDVAEPLGESGVYAEVDAASFTTGHDRRDADVRSARFLDAGRHPVITFVAGGVDSGRITGTLTVRDTTEPVTLEVEHVRVSPESFTVRATTRIDRTRFGVTGAPAMAGRHLDLTLDITCVRP